LFDFAGRQWHEMSEKEKMPLDAIREKDHISIASIG
jgi:hypothetical protein